MGVNRLAFLLLVGVLVFGICSPVIAQETESSGGETAAAQAADPAPQEGDKPFFTFSFGACASWLTRIIFQEERSHFVFRDFMPGLYAGTELRNLRYITPFARLTAYYPLVATFNGMRQDPLLPLHFGIDFLTGIRFSYAISSFNFHAAPALHMLFLNSERWDYFNMGAAAVAGVELALLPRWKLLIDGVASIDNGNLGSNRLMEPFDVAYQYQIGLGVRYSGKMPNEKHMVKQSDRSERSERSDESGSARPKFNPFKKNVDKADPVNPGDGGGDAEDSDGDVSGDSGIDGFESFHR